MITRATHFWGASFMRTDDQQRQESLAEPRSRVQGALIPEILAPAGGREQFFAALNAGADAVFLGLKQFNARSRAENFSIEDLQSLVPMAHRYGMKVLVTLNILIKDTELVELIRTLATLEDLGVHAIIVQDLGVAAIARQHFPSLRLHASTQMAVHNLAGVRKAMAWGFKRVVLARELTALVHGADALAAALKASDILFGGSLPQFVCQPMLIFETTRHRIFKRFPISITTFSCCNLISY